MMTFLGALLIILGVGLMFSASLVGLIFITLGVICISSSNKKKSSSYRIRKSKKKSSKKKLWIAKRASDLMPYDSIDSVFAKVKAETEHTLLLHNYNGDHIQNSPVMSFTSTIDYIKKQNPEESKRFNFMTWIDTSTTCISPNYYKVEVSYLNQSNEKVIAEYYAYYINQNKGWEISEFQIT